MDKAQFDKRFSELNALNIQRAKIAVSVMKKSVRDVLNIVPLLLHYNDPRMPGYRSNGVPFGIDMFVPNEFQRNFLKSKGIDPDLKIEPSYPIYALYTMGSTSSIAQGEDSDLDIWVCVSKDVPSKELNLLVEKCKFISAYAKTLGAELNLFVTVENRFISGEYGAMDTEDCGSAQSLFLLDEFLRSCVRICGRYISWFMISEQEEQENYSFYLDDFYNCSFIKKNEWFDFGSVAKCSPVEYFGSGLWLVYKGIDHPFKAVLKILLMEAYADEYPKTRLLSMELKSEMYRSEDYSIRMDSYYLMYKKVAKFLSKIGDWERLNLAKACFYLKIKEASSSLPKSDILTRRVKFLNRIEHNWGWNTSFADSLTSRKKWNVLNIKNAQQVLLGSLLKSYKALLRFSVVHGIEYAITSDDAGVLSRKIYSAIDRYPGKIMQNYKDVLGFLADETITLVYPSKDSVCRKGWHAFPCAIDSIDLLSTKEVYISDSAVEMVAWLTVNNILTSRTRVDLSAGRSNIDESKIRRLSGDIISFIKTDNMHVSEEDLKKPRIILKSLVVLNFGYDCTRDLMISNSDLELGDSLSCGRQKMCLVGSVDVINLDSWGEVSCYSYPDGEQGVVEILASLARNRTASLDMSGDKLSNFVRFRSYSHVHSDLIRYDMELVVGGIFSCLNDYENNYIFNVGHNVYEARAENKSDIIVVRRSVFRTSDYEETILSRFGMRPEYALQVPNCVERHATVGIMQYFFEKETNTWKIYIVNERNEVKIFYGFKGSRAALVNSINRFYTSQSEKDSLKNFLNFNLPQYFVLSSDQQSIHPFTISNN